MNAAQAQAQRHPEAMKRAAMRWLDIGKFMWHRLQHFTNHEAWVGMFETDF